MPCVKLVRWSGFFVAVFAASLLIGAEPTASKGSKDASPERVDFLAEAKEMNSSRFPAPPQKFRQGHVTPRQLDAKAISKNSRGYNIQLPSKAPVPTPTVYRGKLYVSGGFHSKEFYCFDSATGKLVWGASLDDDGPSSAVCEDGVVVFNTESCTVFALNAETGKMLWSHWLGDPLTSTPTIAGGKLFTSYPARRGGDGKLLENAEAESKAAEKFPKPPVKQKTADVPDSASTAPTKASPKASHVLACFDLKNGKILWQRWLDSDVMSAPVAVDDELFVASFSGVVYRFKQADGSILSAERSRATSAPVVVGKNVYLTLRADDGRDRKAAECVAGICPDSAQRLFTGPGKEAKYLDAQVQVRSGLKGQGNSLDASNGFAGGAPASANAKAAFDNIGQDNVFTMQAFQGSRLLHIAGRNFNCMGDELVCTSAASGKPEWSVKLAGDLEKEGGFLGSPPASAGGQLFVATLKGEVLRVDPRDGKIVETYKVGAPIRFQPAIEGGRIFVGTQNGQVVCIDTGNDKLTGWSTWGGNSAHTSVVIKGE